MPGPQPGGWQTLTGKFAGEGFIPPGPSAAQKLL